MPSTHLKRSAFESFSPAIARDAADMPGSDFVRRHMHNHAGRSLHTHDFAKFGGVFHEGAVHIGRDEPLAVRDAAPADTDDGSERMINILIAILGLAFFALVLLSAFFLFRRRQQMLKKQAESQAAAESGVKNNTLTIETTHNGTQSVVFIGRDGQPMLQNPSAPPHSPDNVPQIHITFPDETDERGQHHHGRVLVVRVGDNATIGLEPVQDEQLPAYEKDAKSQFYSIDMDQIGGLKEKDPALFK